MRSKRTSLSLSFLMMFGASVAAADPESALLQHLKEKYPATQFSSVQPSQFAGLYEVVMGKNIAYTDAKGDLFIFGHVMDLASQRDLTAERQEELRKVDVGGLPTDSSITFVQGKGERQLYVFSDPDCAYCRKLEPELAKLDNVTIHLFPYPLAGLHPDAMMKAVSVWCSKNQAQAWRDLLISNVSPAAVPGCASPLAKNVALAEKLGVFGTPTLVRADGKRQAGALSVGEIDYWLDKR